MERMPNVVGNIWINSTPLTEKDFKNKVVLIDFWAYTCVNCLKTIPYLKKWWKKYKDKDFLIIGIHTPEFEFEKREDNVKKAIDKLEIEWPVVLDNDYNNWNNFANHYWPAKYLTDKQGYIIYTHFGEGAYHETEDKIQELIGEKTKKKGIKAVEHVHGQVCFIPTPELYCGYSRGRLSSPQTYTEDIAADYKMPPVIDKDSIALMGKFLARPEYVESCETDSILYVQFHGTEVNLVMEPVEKEAKVQIFFDNQILLNKTRGKDLDKFGIVNLREAKMYNFLRSSDMVLGLLGIRAEKGNFRAYAFTFSGCEE
ncbi:hypothetical protein C4577_04455 [Candidatus Parcubacteria bacterium]|nr:MAG: hypothetical protein C4577_04455 [Candidatus Parcubacteria bacterium]